MKCEDGSGSEAEVVKLGGEVVVAIVRDVMDDDVLVCSNVVNSLCCCGKSACHVDVLKLLLHFCRAVM